MSKSKSTRSTKVKEESDGTPGKTTTKPSTLPLRKIFYISRQMLDDGDQQLHIEKFYHPGKGKPAFFLTKDSTVMEVLEFAEPRRSWLIDNEVCSNGHLYLSSPVDTAFLALHHIRLHCHDKALAVDSIYDEDDPSVARLLDKFVQPEVLKCFADVKKAGDLIFYKYNHCKCLAWLSIKTRLVADSLKAHRVHCGSSAVSNNFARSEKDIDESATELDYMRMACEYVCGYLSQDLSDELVKHLNIPTEKKTVEEEGKTDATKRKSLDKLANGNKKLKFEAGAMSSLRDSKLIETSLDDEEENRNVNSPAQELLSSPKSMSATPLKERTLTAKEKSLAKGAKGTKSISSFFVKKSA